MVEGSVDMPHCEECSVPVKKEELAQEAITNKLLCPGCSDGRAVIMDRTTILGREFDYEISYTRKNGFKAQAKLGGAKLTFEVDQEELTNIFGPSR
jgi:hypothetical protein